MRQIVETSSMRCSQYIFGALARICLPSNLLSCFWQKQASQWLFTLVESPKRVVPAVQPTRQLAKAVTPITPHSVARSWEFLKQVNRRGRAAKRRPRPRPTVPSYAAKPATPPSAALSCSWVRRWVSGFAMISSAALWDSESLLRNLKCQ